ncbi:aspartate:alanine exchanger family transporter [Vibrio campbellii]|uniref:aspartate:alanine exchanger family transporter n=1 Tax=Vibrio TaxID=662 RepID=UPI0005EE6984|nr:MULTISPECIES: transporter [Vibrio]AQM69359.1 Aspartate/alanine antiporter [Vibrio campbellii]MCE7730381.1 transporter [Vibrio campbellii]NDJ82306.1 transporter [Vibrio sp. LB10LO1]PQJ39740.1 transporter [Vibrio campbellii]CAE6915013.1 Aspartate/alanine antiporter [Vibrio sp. B1FIG11]
MSFLFSYLSENPFVFLFLSLAIGYPLGRLTFKGVSLGTTAGTLVVGVALALTSFSVYGLKIEEPGLVSDIFLMMFMYAIGMKVGPQFFSGLARGGIDFVVIGLIVVFSNFAIVVIGAKLMGLEPGYAAGIISGSYTVTAVMGVAQSAISSGAFTPPEGMSIDHVSANIAAGYAISYVLSTVLIILFIKYLPSLFGIDPVKAGKDAEAEFSTGDDDEKLPSTFGFSDVGVLPIDVRAYKVTHQELVGRSVQELYQSFPDAAVLKVVRGDEVIDASQNPTLALNDVIGIRGEYRVLIAEGEADIGNEVDEPRARNVDIEVADIHVGKSEHAGKTIAQLHAEVGFGVYFKAIFRQGHQQPLLPQTKVEVGDVIRIAGSKWCVEKTASQLNSVAIVESTVTETFYLALSLLVGYIFGHFSVTLAGIPFALGTSAGCMLTGIVFSFLRTRNPAFGGPMSEGARSFLQDIGLNLFVAVLAATVGPKILASFQGIIVIKIALLGVTAALVPPLLAWLYGLYFRKMNPAILAGACAGGRNSTPAMKGAQDASQSDMPAIGYPVPYALTSVLVLILGYIAMVIS